MERGVNFIVIGACFFAGLLGLVAFILWFGDHNLVNPNKNYRAFAASAIDGIKIDSPVKFKGLNVGRVRKIRFKNGGFEEVEFLVSIRGDLALKKGAALKVEQGGLLGGLYLSLSQPENGESLGDEPLKIQGAGLGKITQKIPEITENVEAILSNAQTLLNAQNAENVAKILSLLQDSLSHIAALTKSLEKNTQNIEGLISSLNHAAKTTQESLNLIHAKIKGGEYDLKSTLAPSLISLERSLEGVNVLVKESEDYIKSLKDNPYNAIFGHRTED